MRAGAFDYLQSPSSATTCSNPWPGARGVATTPGGARPPTTPIWSPARPDVEVDALVRRVCRTTRPCCSPARRASQGGRRTGHPRGAARRRTVPQGPLRRVRALLESDCSLRARRVHGRQTRRPAASSSPRRDPVLDEVGELAPATQVKAPARLQDGEFERVGGPDARGEHPGRRRTHRDLTAMRADGRFRDDLYYRLASSDPRAGAARAPEDLADLARQLLARASTGPRARVALPDALAALGRHDDRQRARARERSSSARHPQGPACSRGRLEPLLATRAPCRRGPALPRSACTLAQSPEPARREGCEREGGIERALARTGGNRTRAAKLLGISRRTCTEARRARPRPLSALVVDPRSPAHISPASTPMAALRLLRIRPLFVVGRLPRPIARRHMRATSRIDTRVFLPRVFATDHSQTPRGCPSSPANPARDARHRMRSDHAAREPPTRVAANRTRAVQAPRTSPGERLSPQDPAARPLQRRGSMPTTPSTLESLRATRATSCPSVAASRKPSGQADLQVGRAQYGIELLGRSITASTCATRAAASASSCASTRTATWACTCTRASSRRRGAPRGARSRRASAQLLAGTTRGCASWRSGSPTSTAGAPPSSSLGLRRERRDADGAPRTRRRRGARSARARQCARRRRWSGATSGGVYRHLDVAHLARVLGAGRGAHGGALVATDGVFSMHGHVAPLRALRAAADARGAVLLVDEAHSVGVLGPTGGLESTSGCRARSTCSSAPSARRPAAWRLRLCGRGRDRVPAVFARASVFTAPPPATIAAAPRRSR